MVMSFRAAVFPSPSLMCLLELVCVCMCVYVWSLDASLARNTHNLNISSRYPAMDREAKTRCSLLVNRNKPISSATSFLHSTKVKVIPSFKLRRTAWLFDVRVARVNQTHPSQTASKSALRPLYPSSYVLLFERRAAVFELAVHVRDCTVQGTPSNRNPPKLMCGV